VCFILKKLTLYGDKNGAQEKLIVEGIMEKHLPFYKSRIDNYLFSMLV